VELSLAERKAVTKQMARRYKKAKKGNPEPLPGIARVHAQELRPSMTIHGSPTWRSTLTNAV
jgi:hypothetical protein